MSGSAALLRGINLGGHRKLAMADLREIFAACGAENVNTYVQSGNVVFTGASPKRLVGEVETEIERRLGLDVRVLVRSARELEGLVSANPFPDEGDPTRLHVTFLAEPPAPERVDGIDSAPFAPDEFRIAGREVYLHVPHGYGRTKLGNTFFERKLGVAATTRNWRTVLKLAELTRAAG